LGSFLIEEGPRIAEYLNKRGDLLRQKADATKVNKGTPDDFKNLDEIGLDGNTKNYIKQVRIEARDIINRLEPQHIGGWSNLIYILEECLKKVKINAKIFKY